MSEAMNTPCFFEGKIIPLKDANVNIQTHALQYGTACFGGVRAYYSDNLYLFRVADHYNRLHQSAKILQMKLNYSTEELIQISKDLLKQGEWKCNVYLRPILYKSGYDLSPKLHDIQEQLAIYVIALDDYLDTQGGLRACVSSWRRIHDTQMSPRAKATGGYLNSALAKSEALENGFDEAIFLDINGYVSEGSAEIIFLVTDGVLITPDLSSSILASITRKTIIELAKDEGIEVVERNVSRSDLYVADEVFFAGTGVQVAWIKEIDRRIIGSGKIGAVTSVLQKSYFDMVNGKNKKHGDWLTSIY